MKKYLTLFVIFAVMATVSSCAPKRMYYWGQYSNTYYDLQKENSEENLADHKSALKEIIEKSEAEYDRVPPGIYSEYGYILMSTGQKKEAVSYFKKEMDVYPESRVLMEALIRRCDPKALQDEKGADKNVEPAAPTGNKNSDNDKLKDQKNSGSPQADKKTLETKNKPLVEKSES